jgi:hypothetical protein
MGLLAHLERGQESARKKSFAKAQFAQQLIGITVAKQRACVASTTAVKTRQAIWCTSQKPTRSSARISNARTRNLNIAAVTSRIVQLTTAR